MYTGKIFWGYFIEVLLLLCIFTLLNILITNQVLCDFVINTSGLFTTLIGAILLFSASFLLIFIRWMTTDFGDYLNWRKADRVYRTSLGYSLFIDMLAFLSLIVLGYAKSAILANVAIILIIYTLINIKTMITNILDLVKLKNYFRREVESRNTCDEIRDN